MEYATRRNPKHHANFTNNAANEAASRGDITRDEENDSLRTLDQIHLYRQVEVRPGSTERCRHHHQSCCRWLDKDPSLVCLQIEQLVWPPSKRRRFRPLSG